VLEQYLTIANPERVVAWLEQELRSQLKPDVSNYARGRLRAWLRTEPTLTNPTRELPGVEVSDQVLGRLAELIEWDFDYCLVTNSGARAAGISPHRDAAFTGWEGRGLHLSGECLFTYWCDRQLVDGPGPRANLNSEAEPTQSLVLLPGQCTRFNVKNLHAAEPGPDRWALNFWRRKPAKA
jgi:hypothetical protein